MGSVKAIVRIVERNTYFIFIVEPYLIDLLVIGVETMLLPGRHFFLKMEKPSTLPRPSAIMAGINIQLSSPHPLSFIPPFDISLLIAQPPKIITITKTTTSAMRRGVFVFEFMTLFSI
jgi:hypothetical protein